MLFILLLKAFRILPDPPEYLEVVAGVGATIGVLGGQAWIFNKIFTLDGRLSALESKSEALEERLDEALNRLGKIEDRVSRLDDEFKRFKSDICLLQGNKSIRCFFHL